MFNPCISLGFPRFEWCLVQCSGPLIQLFRGVLPPPTSVETQVGGESLAFVKVLCLATLLLPQVVVQLNLFLPQVIAAPSLPKLRFFSLSSEVRTFRVVVQELHLILAKHLIVAEMHSIG